MLKELKNFKVMGGFGKKLDALDGLRWLKMVLEVCSCIGRRGKFLVFNCQFLVGKRARGTV
jgi:hypothetical protein